MNVEIGIQNTAKTISFESTQTAQEVSTIVQDALDNHASTVQLTDAKGRHYIVPVSALGYIVLGSESAHPVGFGAL